MIILVADSGSTKTDWVIADTTTLTRRTFQTQGLNPCLMNDDAILDVLTSSVAPEISVSTISQTTAAAIDRIFFYGAGCRPDQTARMNNLLHAALGAEAVVASDLLGAAHALCGDRPGIVAILGTGSGSAVYDGQTFTLQTPSLGFILGDEGSGAVLGRRLLGDIFKRQLPQPIVEAFQRECGVTIDEAIRRVYREPSPNRFLAQFTRFIKAHIDEPSVRSLVVDEFRHFFLRNCAAYRHTNLPVNFVGSIAAVFADEIREAAASTHFEVGTVLPSPISSLVDYCCGKCQ